MSSTAKLKHLLQNKDAADVAFWAHSVEGQFPQSIGLHFQGQSSGSSCVADSCPNGRCLSKAIKALVTQLQGGGDMSEAVFGRKLTDADAVRYLINLLGDIHQPLHVGKTSGNFGREQKLKTTFSDSDLFAFWDSGLTAVSIDRSGGGWYSGWTNVGNLKSWDEEKRIFRDKGLSVVDDWIVENANIACSKIYGLMPPPKDGVLIISDALVLQWMQLLRERILLAGARAALILGLALGTKSASAFRGGSSFVEQPIPEDDKFTTKSGGAIINAFVLMVVIIAVFLFNHLKLGDAIEVHKEVEMFVKKNIE